MQISLILKDKRETSIRSNDVLPSGSVSGIPFCKILIPRVVP
ncbi:hypothetical protein [Stygiobacter electus]|uniref:Uncharacterized protein n=1 Tax=Stygiobacter electus TaxID=3032292 RepID=A0AAE3NYZ1_9BACT|nr:hypothetical protein [Stygiobacter electus]MDF1611064.1 hypothetical protein [Stygiobacter electus]